MGQNKQVRKRTIQTQLPDFCQNHKDNSMEKGKSFPKNGAGTKNGYHMQKNQPRYRPYMFFKK